MSDICFVLSDISFVLGYAFIQCCNILIGLMQLAAVDSVSRGFAYFAFCYTGNLAACYIQATADGCSVFTKHDGFCTIISTDIAHANTAVSNCKVFITIGNDDAIFIQVNFGISIGNRGNISQIACCYVGNHFIVSIKTALGNISFAVKTNATLGIKEVVTGIHAVNGQVFLQFQTSISNLKVAFAFLQFYRNRIIFTINYDAIACYISGIFCIYGVDVLSISSCLFNYRSDVLTSFNFSLSFFYFLSYITANIYAAFNLVIISIS